MKLPRKRWIAIAVLTVGIVAWMADGPLPRALLRSTDQFLTWPGDPRVRYEPGAEVMAQEVAASLPLAIRTVEERQYRPFAQPPSVFVCASLATYGSYGGDVRSGGYVVNRRLFISPKPENTLERIPRVVTHELSHLHLEQHYGVVRLKRLPMWFTEGLAAFVSDGAGAEQASEDDAKRAIVDGRVFVPETSTGLFERQTPSTYRLTPHLFYREGAMFLAALKRRDESKSRQLLLGIEDGDPLGSAFDRAYGESVLAAWNRFVAEVKDASR